MSATTTPTPAHDDKPKADLASVLKFLAHHFPNAEGLPPTEEQAKAAEQHPQQHTASGGVQQPHKGA